MGWLALCRTRDSLPPPLATGRYMELREDTIVTRQNAMPRLSAYLSADGCATNSSLPPSAPLNGAIYMPKKAQSALYTSLLVGFFQEAFAFCGLL